jgi:hypothetical protein
MDTPRPDTASANPSNLPTDATSAGNDTRASSSVGTSQLTWMTPEPLPQSPPVLEWSPAIHVIQGRGFLTDDKDPENQIAFKATQAELVTLAKHHLDRTYYFKAWYAATRNTGGFESREEIYSEVRFSQIYSLLDTPARQKLDEVVAIRNLYIDHLTEGYVDEDLYGMFDHINEDVFPAVSAGDSICDAGQHHAEKIDISEVSDGVLFILVRGWKTLSPARADKLARHFQYVTLPDLESLTAEVAARLAQGSYQRLDLGVKELSDESVELIAACKGAIHLPNLTKVSERAVQAFARHEGYLNLGVRELNEQQAKTLVLHRGELVLDRLERATPRALFWLWRSRHVTVTGALRAPEVAAEEDVRSPQSGDDDWDEEAAFAYLNPRK